MKIIVQVVAIVCGAYGAMLHLPFADSLENTPADVMRAELRALEHTHPFTAEQRVIVDRSLERAYAKSVEERYNHHLRAGSIGRFMLVLAIVAFIGACRMQIRNKTPDPTPTAVMPSAAQESRRP